MYAPLHFNLPDYILAKVYAVFRKFFGRPNGSVPNPKQSTLAFQKSPSTNTVEAGNVDVNRTGNTKKRKKPQAVKTEDVGGGVDMDTKSEIEKHTQGTHEETVVGDSSNIVVSSTPSERGQVEARDSSPLQKKITIKRSEREVEEEEDEEVEEPVRKRSRRAASPERSNHSTKQPSSERQKKSTMQTASISPNVGKSKAEPKRPIKGDGSKKTPKALESELSIVSEEVNRPSKTSISKATKHIKEEEQEEEDDIETSDEVLSGADDEEVESEDDKPEIAAKAREKVQETLKSSGKDPYPDWKPGEPVPYAALCTTFSLIEMTTKRLIISSHCSLFLRQVLRLTPDDLLPTIQLMINKLAADYAGIELGIGESLIMKAIGETTGRSLQIIKADQNEIGDLGLVAAKSRSNQPTMFKPKPLTVRGVLDGLMAIATVSGDGSQGRKIAGIKKLLSAADASPAGKGSNAIDITKDKGGASEAKFIVRFLEGKLRLGLAEKTVLVGLAHAMVIHEVEGKKGNKLPSSEKLAEGEAILKTVYRYFHQDDLSSFADAS